MEGPGVHRKGSGAEHCCACPCCCPCCCCAGGEATARFEKEPDFGIVGVRWPGEGDGEDKGEGWVAGEEAGGGTAVDCAEGEGCGPRANAEAGEAVGRDMDNRVGGGAKGLMERRQSPWRTGGAAELQPSATATPPPDRCPGPLPVLRDDRPGATAATAGATSRGANRLLLLQPPPPAPADPPAAAAQPHSIPPSSGPPGMPSRDWPDHVAAPGSDEGPPAAV